MTEALTEAALFELLSLECRVDSHGNVRYYNAQVQLHRVHGPAVMHENGKREWWQAGILHRVDGPAVERPDGFRSWWQNGWLHRVDGPAVEYSDGSCGWHINGKSLTETEWQQAAASMENV